MTEINHGQVSASAADIYESFFVPALFGQWTGAVLDAAGASRGETVLDVGCGSGALTRAALARVGEQGTVVGLDPNEGMLAVARRTSDGAAWYHGFAEDLPFDDRSFDRVVSQFALMFFTDRAGAVREMARVARPHGRCSFAVWASIEDSPGYEALAALVLQMFGSAASEAIRAPFALGDPVTVHQLLARSFPDPVVTRHEGVARFESLSSWLNTEIRGWTLSEMIDDDGFESLLRQAEVDLSGLVDRRGHVTFPVSALVANGGVRP